MSTVLVYITAEQPELLYLQPLNRGDMWLMMSQLYQISILGSLCRKLTLTKFGWVPPPPPALPTHTLVPPHKMSVISRCFWQTGVGSVAGWNSLELFTQHLQYFFAKFVPFFFIQSQSEKHHASIVCKPRLPFML